MPNTPTEKSASSNVEDITQQSSQHIEPQQEIAKNTFTQPDYYKSRKDNKFANITGFFDK